VARRPLHQDVAEFHHHGGVADPKGARHVPASQDVAVVRRHAERWMLTGALARQDRGAAASERLEDDVALVHVAAHQELWQHHKEHRGMLGLDVAAFVAGQTQHVVGDPEVLVFEDGPIGGA